MANARSILSLMKPERVLNIVVNIPARALLQIRQLNEKFVQLIERLAFNE
jgi:hypothetical protein